jgi:hypothetical protein
VIVGLTGFALWFVLTLLYICVGLAILVIYLVCIKEERKQPPLHTQPVYAPVYALNPSTNTAQPILMPQTNAN